ncbi:carbohydrate ABC transporter permease [Mumia sp. DW29H23]|uniref:carbohydrate ABC transporter permease n=1 Tax=Mumia sp. DW29H23 TaxID=3421241 RepID=UPI003D68C230
MATTVPAQVAEAPPPQPPRQRIRHKGAIVGFLAPFLVLFVLFYLAPIAYAVWQSFFKVEREGTFGKAREVFGGLEQYGRVLDNPDFWASIGRVLVFFVASIPLQLGLALLFALLLDSPLVKVKSFFRLAFFAPYAVPGVIAAIMWGFLYSPEISPFPQVANNVDLLGPGLVMFSMVNVVNWVYIGYNMLIIYAALQAIPKDTIEAATLDGAGQMRIAWSVKIPSVAPALVLTGVFSIIGTLQLFNEPRVFRAISSAVGRDYTPNLMVDATSSIPDYHLAAAMSVVLALITCTLSFTFLKITQKRALG